MFNPKYLQEYLRDRGMMHIIQIALKSEKTVIMTYAL
jgi:hypothetical protein